MFKVTATNLASLRLTEVGWCLSNRFLSTRARSSLMRKKHEGCCHGRHPVSNASWKEERIPGRAVTQTYLEIWNLKCSSFWTRPAGLQVLPPSGLCATFDNSIPTFYKQPYLKIFLSGFLLSVLLIIRTRLESLCNQHRQSVCPSVSLSVRQGSHTSHH